ncbi:MAG TPA: hypothetical protein VFM11_04270 [Burkholderiales bacterium]|nr:hypothetical protein [Burkholderiales bacterium]
MIVIKNEIGNGIPVYRQPAVHTSKEEIMIDLKLRNRRELPT